MSLEVLRDAFAEPPREGPLYMNNQGLKELLDDVYARLPRYLYDQLAELVATVRSFAPGGMQPAIGFRGEFLVGLHAWLLEAEAELDG